MAPSKKIIICCDGTGNDSDGTMNVPTNVAKIARCLDHAGPAVGSGKQIPQFVYYQSGVGTKSSGSVGHAFDGLTGRGITENIRSSYSFICNNYEPDDEIYLIGFSRGAYTARCLSTLINDIGILTKHALGYFYDIFSAWQAKNIVAKHDPKHPGPPRYLEVSKVLDSDPQFAFNRFKIRITVCAVFDTVGSLGIAATESDSTVDYIKDTLRGAGLLNWLPGLGKGTEAFEFVDTDVSPNIDHAFQALALDEHRGHFPPTVWENHPKSHDDPHPDFKCNDLQQCWFAGCHSHVGGGVVDNNELPNISLAWMLDRLSPYLSFNPDQVNRTHSDDKLIEKLGVRPELAGTGHLLTDSRKGFYQLDGNVPRTPGQYRTHRKDKATGKELDEPLQNTNETVHQSVRLKFWNSRALLKTGEEYQPLALKGRWKLGTESPWPWKLLAVADHVKDLPEAQVGKREGEILKSWGEECGGATQ